MRGVTCIPNIRCKFFENFYSHTSCEVWRYPEWKITVFWISTHTPHARCDISSLDYDFYQRQFLLTHLMRGVTRAVFPTVQKLLIFLLTHLMRGVTEFASYTELSPGISTHTPHARCDVNGNWANTSVFISTHTPHARCDTMRLKNSDNHLISTHTPHARCDWMDKGQERCTQ